MEIEMDSLKLKDTHTRLTPTIMAQANSFHSFAIAHNNFAPNFAADTCLLFVPLVWDNATPHIFDTLQLLHAQIFALPHVGYTHTLLVPIFAKCLLELSLRKWFFSKFFFDRDYPTLQGTTVMDYLFDEEEQESRTTLPQGGGDDVAPPKVDTTSRPTSPPRGPMT